MRFFLLLFTLICFEAWAAPIPATTSSMVITEKPGIFRSPIGFEINAADTGWVQVPPPGNNKYIATVYRNENLVDGIQPALTVRVDKLEKPISLKMYTKRWMKDYPRLGFEILAAKKVKVGGEVAFMLDIFNNTLKSCNEIFRTFIW